MARTILNLGPNGAPIPAGPFGDLIAKLRADGTRFTYEPNDDGTAKLCAFGPETGALLLEADLSNGPPEGSD